MRIRTLLIFTSDLVLMISLFPVFMETRLLAIGIWFGKRSLVLGLTEKIPSACWETLMPFCIMVKSVVVRDVVTLLFYPSRTCWKVVICCVAKHW